MKKWLELQKKGQELFDEISIGISNNMFTAVLTDIVRSDNDTIDQLEYYIKDKEKNQNQFNSKEKSSK